MPKKKRRKKLPHKFGSISELSKNRTKRFWARKPSITNPDGKTYRESVGFFKTYEEAYEALLNPLKYDSRRTTFNDVFNSLINSREYESMTVDTLNRYKADFIKLGDLRYEVIQEVNFSMLQAKIDEIERIGYKKDGTRISYSKDKMKKIKTVLNKIYIRAIQDGIITANLAENLRVDAKETEKEFNIFTIEEINRLFELIKDNKNIRFILLHIFTGLRTIEMVNLKKQHINLLNSSISGMGSKTTTGKLRTVILHKRILPIVKELYNETNDYILGEKMSTTVYRNRIFKKSLDEVGMLNGRTPYDCRDTFAYLMNHYKVDRETIKQMMGHKDYATTSNNYISFDAEKAKEELEKITL